MRNRENALRSNIEDASYLTTSAGEADVIQAHPHLYISLIENEFPLLGRLFRRLGIHPTEKVKLSDPYTHSTTTENFSNIGEHLLIVAWCAKNLGLRLLSAGKMSAEEVQCLTERALIHDALKPYEVLRRKAIAAGRLSGELESASPFEELRATLNQLGFPESTIDYLRLAGQETGHGSLSNYLEVTSDGITTLVKGRLAEKIVHIVDNMTCSTMPDGGSQSKHFILTPWDRMLAARFLEKYPWLWKEGLVHTADGSIISVPDVNALAPGHTLIGSFANLQLRVSHLICAEIREFLAPESQAAPTLFVRDLLTSFL